MIANIDIEEAGITEPSEPNSGNGGADTDRPLASEEGGNGPEAPVPSPRLRPTEEARLALNRVIDDSSLSLRQAFQQICQISADTLEVERVGVWLMSDDRLQLRCVNLFERSRSTHSVGPTIHVADFPIYFAAIRERRVLPCELVQSDPRAIELRDSYLVPLGITSMLDAPIRRGDEVIGVVCHEHVGLPREWPTEARDFAMSVADAAAYRLRLAECQLHNHSVGRPSIEVLPGGDRYSLVGQLVSGVAHDFRNYLTMVLGNAALITRRSDVPAEVRRWAEQVVEAGERASQLIRDLLEFGREPVGHPRLISVSETLQRFLPLLQAGVGRLYPIELHPAEEQDQVWIDPAHLERVVMNLVLNARESMPRGGLISIRVRVVTLSEGDVLPGCYVCLEVQDAGGGIEPEHLERIFEPHFTTKLNGPGRGLGLVIVRRIVERAGGLIRVQSGLGQGSLFQIYLPRATGLATKSAGK